MTPWDAEYVRRGIPSSYRDGPSGAVTWAVGNLAASGSLPSLALDVGCGTGRNAAYLAGLGVDVVAFDSSPVALEAARSRLERTPPGRVAFSRHDLRDGLPAGDSTIDLAVDSFVYKHQVDPRVRRRHRAEARRVLRPNARLLLSLAEPEDAYYASCPRLADREARPRAAVDPEVGVASVLFTLDELIQEMGDTFELERVRRQAKPGLMHGRWYLRRTLATMWRPTRC